MVICNLYHGRTESDSDRQSWAAGWVRDATGMDDLAYERLDLAIESFFAGVPLVEVSEHEGDNAGEARKYVRGWAEALGD